MTQCFVHSNYSLNPDRGTIYGWNISYDASDTWWWRKVDCETGEKAVGNGIGACSAYPESVPSNVSGCYSYNGSCYICDKSKGDYVDCNADWLWKYNFPYHDWFKQVDCYDPYEEDTEVCYEVDLAESETYLLKQMSEYVFYNDTVLLDNDALELNSDARYYDVLGRNLEYKMSFNLEKTVYQKVRNESKNNKMLRAQALPKSNILSGYVKGTPKMRVCYKYLRTEGNTKFYASEGSLRIIVGKLVYQGNDKRLIAHEKKHKEIWSDSQYSGKWTIEFSATLSKTKKEICKSAVEIMWWQKMKDVLNKLYTAQNEWDDKDENNECKERIDINSVLTENYEILMAKTCK